MSNCLASQGGQAKCTCHQVPCFSGPVTLDTPIFIYFIEEDRRFRHIVRRVLEAIDRGVLDGVTSGLTLLEVLVAPYRAGNFSLAERYEALLTRSRGFRLVVLDLPLLKAAALLRPTVPLTPADAIQIGAGLASRSLAFLTNDRKIPPLPGVKILQLHKYLRAR